MTDECEFFVWIGAAGCDRCGRPAREHKGFQTIRPGARILGADRDPDPYLNVTWEQHDMQEDLLAGRAAVVV